MVKRTTRLQLVSNPKRQPVSICRIVTRFNLRVIEFICAAQSAAECVPVSSVSLGSPCEAAGDLQQPWRQPSPYQPPSVAANAIPQHLACHVLAS